MNVRNCVKCGKIFNYVAGKPICPNCKKDLESHFKEVRDYIKRNPHASIAEVSENCETTVNQIKEWVREERLSFSKDSGIGIDCEGCGKTIKTGRFCDDCKKTLSDDLRNASRRVEPEKKAMDNPFAKEAQKKKDGDARLRFSNKDWK